MRAPSPPSRRVLGDRYECHDVLGVGASGTVFAGHDRRLDRPVAVKVVDPAGRTPQDLERVVREARASARIVHPAVVTVFDFGTDDGAPFLVMERLPGRTLADELRDGPVDPARVVEIGRQVLAGVAAAHDAGVLHRDIKPSNVLVCEDGTVKLADFGIAVSGTAPRLTAHGDVLGTPSYLAPERLLGEPASPRSDLYAVGVLLRELVTGTTPFAGDTPAAVVHAVTAGVVDPIDQVAPHAPDGLRRAIDHAMARRPEDRPVDAAALLAHLDGAPAADATTRLALPMTDRLGVRPGPVERTTPVPVAEVPVDVAPVAPVSADVAPADEAAATVPDDRPPDDRRRTPREPLEVVRWAIAAAIALTLLVMLLDLAVWNRDDDTTPPAADEAPSTEADLAPETDAAFDRLAEVVAG